MSSSFEENFCGGEFWNENVTWNTDHPDLTPCFHKTVLAWTPSLILFLISLFEVRKYSKQPNRDIPWNIYNVIKTLLTVCLVVLACTELVFMIVIGTAEKEVDDLVKIYPVDYVTNVVYILTYAR